MAQLPCQNLTALLTWNWNKEPDNYDTQDCVTINQYGRFSDDLCNSKYPYICKFPKTEQEYCPTSADDVRWAFLIYACYWIADASNPAEFLTWQDAWTKCQTLNPLRQGGMHLLSVTSGIESEFLLSDLPYRSTGVSTPWWTGLNDRVTEALYKWEDGQMWNSSLTPWDNAPSNGSEEKCAIMYRSGVVDDFKCSGRSHFICEKSATKQTLTLGCPTHWIRAGHSCYLLANNSQVTWFVARTTCQKGGGDLLKADSIDEKYWLGRQMIGNGGYWTGLNDQHQEGEYRWADGTQLNIKFIQWDKEPNNGLKNEDCGMITRDGGFSDVDCLNKNGYICEYVNDQGAKCIPGWVTDGGSGCYYFSSLDITELMMWSEVGQACRDKTHQFDVDLQAGYLCLDTRDEVAFITSQLALKDVTSRGWWTGLNDRAIEGQWNWQRVYDTVVDPDLIQWNGEPNNYKNEDCTTMLQGGRYNDLDCQATVNYICERTAGSSITYNSWWTTVVFLLVSTLLIH